MYGLVNAKKKGRAAGALSREQAEWRAVIISSPQEREASAGFQKVQWLTDESNTVTSSQAPSRRVRRIAGRGLDGAVQLAGRL
jgi:hypothetical protein